ncbi:MAG: TIGR03905 family TSCPD domain-containing protein [Agathobacter sp.]|nr:TIGR03905 family TSCPD domain-containing protein [Agathobacter sp.]MDY3887631.1 TIGR03905 family TSCPD domain-containing protein [Agathobacter sp.]
MSYTYKTSGTCSTQIDFELDGNVIHNVRFTGGCNGNLKAVSSLVEGQTVENVVERLAGIKCGFKNTSCGDQLSKALLEAYQK